MNPAEDPIERLIFEACTDPLNLISLTNVHQDFMELAMLGSDEPLYVDQLFPEEVCD